MTADDRSLFLSTAPAERHHRFLAAGVVLVALASFAAAVPFARLPFTPVPPFLAVYETALVACDVVTAIMLFGQFAILRSRALLVLAAGYAFAALMTVAHGLSFPGLFAAEGLLGAGLQSTAWLYIFWHGGFPIAVIAYALLRGRNRAESQMRAPASRAVAGALLAALSATVALTLLATGAEPLLPTIMNGQHLAPAIVLAISPIWLLGLIGLFALWRSRPHAVLDLWLMVVMCAWLLDVALSLLLNAGRFDFGFYAGRAYGLLAAGFVLAGMLVETNRLYGRLAVAAARLSDYAGSLEERVRGRTAELIRSNDALEDTIRQLHQRERMLHELQSELLHVSRLSTMGEMASALAHELNQPLTAVATYLQASKRLLGESADQRTEKLMGALNSAAGQALRAGQVIRRLRAFIARGETERQAESLKKIVEEASALALVAAREHAVQVAFRFDPRSDLVLVDKVQIQQVLLNLLRNAIEAMQSSEHRELVVASEPAANRMVAVTVADTGPGIPPDVMMKLFQPFVTTKPQGMGIGLSISRTIVEAHGGEIAASANPRGGTIFRFTIPAAASDEGR